MSTEPKRMKSDAVNKNWADTLQFVRTGGTVIVEHYNKPIATITPYEEPAVSECTCYAPEDAEPEDHDEDCPENPGLD